MCLSPLTCFVGLFLLFYRGQSRAERFLAVAGGILAVLVALNPTDGSGCDGILAPSRIFFLDPADLKVTSAFPVDSWAGTIHGIAAVLLFLILAIFNLFVFTATDQNNDYQTRSGNRNKQIRNIIYGICGWLMIAAIVILAIGIFAGFKKCEAFSDVSGITMAAKICTENPRFDSLFWDDNNLTFYFEWLALATFGIAWFVKGRGGGFLLLDEKPDERISRPWWWRI